LQLGELFSNHPTTSRVSVMWPHSIVLYRTVMAVSDGQLM